MTQTQSIQVGTAVTTSQAWPYNEGIVEAIDGQNVTIGKYGRMVRDYVGGGTFTVKLAQCTRDEEISLALITINSYYREAAALKREREAAGIRLESRAEYDLKHEARRLQRAIDSL